MKNILKKWKSNRTVHNPAQAGDVALALFYGQPTKVPGETILPRVVTVHTNIMEFINYNSTEHHGKDFTLEFHGTSKGIVNISLFGENLPKEASLYEAIWKMNFSERDMLFFTHVIVKTVSSSFEMGEGQVEYIDIYRINDAERYQFANKTLYF